MCATVSTMLASAPSDSLEHVAGVAGGAEAHHLERGALVGGPVPHLGEHVLHVLDRVALRQGVDLLEDFSDSSMNTHFDEVEPPSRPITPR
jgi:hypothetical protein